MCVCVCVCVCVYIYVCVCVYTHTYVHALRNYVLEHAFEENIEGTGRRGRIRKQILDDVGLEPFAATEFNKILSVRQPCRCVKVLSSVSGCYLWVLLMTWSAAPCRLGRTQSLKRWRNLLTPLSAREDLIELLDELKETRKYCKSQEEALDRTVW